MSFAFGRPGASQRKSPTLGAPGFKTGPCDPCVTWRSPGARIASPYLARAFTRTVRREILREARQFNPREFRVLAHQKVIDKLSEEESQHLAGLSDFIGKPISLLAEAGFHQDEYDVVLI